MEFGDWLLAQLEQRGMSMADFARRLNVSQTAVSRWVHGQNRPDIESALNIARVLNLDVGLLLAKTGHEDEAVGRLKRLHARLDALRSDLNSIDFQLERLRQQRDDTVRQIEQTEVAVLEEEAAGLGGKQMPPAFMFSTDMNVPAQDLGGRLLETVHHRLNDDWTDEQRAMFLKGVEAALESLKSLLHPEQGQ